MQEQLAKYLCVFSQTISRWKIGVTYSDISSFPQIAEVFV